MSRYSPARHLLNEPQTNLGLPNTPHAIQQKEFSAVESIIAFGSKMFPQFCENVGPTCEPNAGIWFYGNRCIGCHRVASASVIFDLHAAQDSDQLAIDKGHRRASRTESAAMNVPPLILGFWAPGKTCFPLMLEV